MDFNQAFEHFMTELERAGFEPSGDVVSDPPLEFKFRESRFSISREQIQDFSVQYEQLREMVVEPNPCSIVSKKYREQAIEDPRRLFIVRPDLLIKFTEGETTMIEVGTASSLFVNAFRFDKSFIRGNIQTFRLADGVTFPLNDILRKTVTIKIFDLECETVQAALEKSDQIIQSTLFDLAYLKRRSFRIKQDWALEREIPRRYPFERLAGGNTFRFREIRYEPDIVRFYQRGVGSTDAVIQFLSFYQVLEYFFVNVADETLYEKLSRRINNPKFSAKVQHLDLLIKDTLEHKKETDETEMLKLVLTKYVPEDELIETLREIEDHQDNGSYIKKQSIFGEDVEIKLIPGHVIGNLAKRIKIIRNALVHSSDRYERNERFVPTSENEKKIALEIPLLKFLAEKVIINSAKSATR